ncbi:major facilitator superfamily protein, putative, partial [Ichthyophthirius multifiliis]
KMKCLSQQSLKANQIFVFIFTFLCYSAVHSTRTAWSVSKGNFQHKIQCSKSFLGWMDFCFLFSYAMSLKIGGSLGDRINLIYYLSIGMILSSIFLSLDSLIGISNFPNEALFLIFMSLNGIFQSTAWPGLLSTMGNWFGKGNRGLMMGIWSANSNIGNIIGQLIGQLTIDIYKWGWEYCLLISSLFLLLMGILVLLFLQPYPEKSNIYEKVVQNTDQSNNSEVLNQNIKKQTILRLGQYPVFLYMQQAMPVQKALLTAYYFGFLTIYKTKVWTNIHTQYHL